jgi:hypothetical protein
MSSPAKAARSVSGRRKASTSNCLESMGRAYHPSRIRAGRWPQSPRAPYGRFVTCSRPGFGYPGQPGRSPDRRYELGRIEPSVNSNFDLSADGSRLVEQRFDENGASLWMRDLRRDGLASPLVGADFDPTLNPTDPTFNPRGESVAFTAAQGGTAYRIYVVPAQGGEPLVASGSSSRSTPRPVAPNAPRSRSSSTGLRSWCELTEVGCVVTWFEELKVLVPTE